MRISHKTLVLVADGQNATFFKNSASGETITLETVHSMGLVNEADRDISADRPGHAHVGMSERRTSYEHDDKHQANETAFLAGVAGMAQQLSGDYDSLVLIAEPRALGVLRDVMAPAVMSKVTVQMDKDYTKTPVPELEALLRQA
jgi:protein required for attachment to host cells